MSSSTRLGPWAGTVQTQPQTGNCASGWSHGVRWRRARGGGAGVPDRRLQPLPTGASPRRLPGVLGWTSWARGIGSASTPAPPPHLQRPCAAGGFLGTQGCARGLPAPLGADGQEDRGGSLTPAPATQQAAQRGGAPSAARIGSAAQVTGRGPRQGNRKEVKISGSSILCHEGWAGVARAQPRGHLSAWGGAGRLQFGRWLRFRDWGRLAARRRLGGVT